LGKRIDVTKRRICKEKNVAARCFPGLMAAPARIVALFGGNDEQNVMRAPIAPGRENLAEAEKRRYEQGGPPGLSP
jgi:hypothetical protein